MATRKRTTKRKQRYAPGSRAGKGGRKPRDPSGAGPALYARTTASEYATIATGAVAAGAQVPDFVRTAALEAARKVLRDAGLQESPAGLSISAQ
jgi:hypothetical protein